MQSPRYRCAICQHIYDPQEGDGINDTPPGTAFADLPDSWACPDCGATKADFEPLAD